MRYIERDVVEPPSWFRSKDARASRALVAEFFQQDQKILEQRRFKDPVHNLNTPFFNEEISASLTALFSGKCAFCESRAKSLEIYRFRPASSASPVTAADRARGQLYYIWLAEAWQNLYPLCQECEPDDIRYFPVIGKERAAIPSPEDINEFVDRQDGRWPLFPLDEKPVFVDPCYDRALWRHFRYFPKGTIEARDRRGRETITHFKLHRTDLAFARRDVFFARCNAVTAYLEALEPSSDHRDALLETSAHEFSGGWLILLREALKIALGRSRPSTNLTTTLDQLFALDDRVDRFHEAIEKLSFEENELSARMGADPEELSRSGFYKQTYQQGLPRKFTIINFKSLEHLVVDVPSPPLENPEIAPALLILGENAAGKSTVLEAVTLSLISPNIRKMLRLQGEKLVLNPDFLGGSRQQRPKVSRVNVSYETGADQRFSITLDDAYERSDFESEGPQTLLPIFAYGAFRQFLDSERRRSAHRHVRSLFEPDELLSNPEKWLLRLSNPDFQMVARALREVFVFQEDYDVLARDENGLVYVIARYKKDGEQGTMRTPLKIVSSGFRSVLAMLCDIMFGLMDKKRNPDFELLETAEAIVLIDEIEAHLHPRWKVSIMTGLRRALPKVCFIATSHDPLCLRGMYEGEVVVMERVENQADDGLPVIAQSLTDLPDTINWTIEQLLTADFFQLRNTEGERGERAISQAADALSLGESALGDHEYQIYTDKIRESLPIGDTDVMRLINEAIAEYLARRRSSNLRELKALRDSTKQRILDALGGYDAPR